MSRNRKYPRIGDIRTLTYPKGLCCVCHQPKSEILVEVEWNCMRGDDDVEQVHKACLPKFKTDFAAKHKEQS